MVGIGILVYMLVGMIVSYYIWCKWNETSFLMVAILWPIFVLIEIGTTLDVALAKLFVFIRNKTRRGQDG